MLLWPAFRLGRRAASLGLVILMALAMFGTLSGYGPFVSATPTASLMMVVSYMSLMSVLIQSLAALAAEYAVAESQLRDLVVTDPMTGLPNYRRLVEVLTEEITRANRTDTTFAVVFCDMDGLKQINDELGHLIGSRAVCRFADTLKACVRDTDTAARYGGDEFVAVLPGADEAGARAVIDRLTTSPGGGQGQARARHQRRRRRLSARRQHGDDPPQRRRSRAVRRQGAQGQRPSPRRRSHQGVDERRARGERRNS